MKKKFSLKKESQSRTFNIFYFFNRVGHFWVPTNPFFFLLGLFAEPQFSMSE